jgi:GDPmannose 4,6-dehydratase
MWMMLQQTEPDDYVVATGETHSPREFIELAFARAGVDDWRRYVKTDQRHFRPSEVDHLVGDASKAQDKLGWAPRVKFQQLVEMMVAHDLKVEGEKAERRAR